jgi:hypothetical protein
MVQAIYRLRSYVNVLGGMGPVDRKTPFTWLEQNPARAALLRALPFLVLAPGLGYFYPSVLKVIPQLTVRRCAVVCSGDIHN